MVESINSVNGASYVYSTEAVKKTEKTDEVGNNNDQVAKTGQTSQVAKTEEQEQTQQTEFSRDDLILRIQTYIENLKKNYPSQEIKDRIDLYVSAYTIDDFMKEYPVITSEEDLNIILHDIFDPLIY